MAALAFLVALFQTITTTSFNNGSLWTYNFFQNLLADNIWVENAWVWIWIAQIIISLLMVALLTRFFGKRAFFCSGCIGVVLGILVLFFPIVQHFIVLLCQVMAGSVTPQGVTNWFPLVLCGIAYLMFCGD